MFHCIGLTIALTCGYISYGRNLQLKYLETIIDAAVRHWHVGMQLWFMKLMIQASSRRDCKTLPPDSHMARLVILCRVWPVQLFYFP